MDFDLNELRNPSRLNFPSTITPLNIEMIITSGFTDEVAISEMEFYKSNASASNFEYNNIFENILADKLKPNVTLANIDAMQSKFYKSLAKCLFNKTYDASRSKSYTVFRQISDVHTELKVNGRNNVENATGIYANLGDTVVVLVNGIPAGVRDISIKVWNQETGINSGPFSNHLIVNGFNSFVAPNSGLLYINYYNNNLNLNAININIVTGKVNGVFELNKTSNSDWLKMLDNDHSPLIDLVGENTQILASKYALKEAGVLEPNQLLEYYDLINKNQYLLSGFYKYNRVHKNRMFNYIHGTTGSWMATANGISLHHGAGAEKSLVVSQMSLWGVGHEFGHNNQIRPHLNFAGFNEVTNNIFSSFTVQTLGTNTYRKLSALETDESSYKNTTNANDPLNGIPSKVGGFMNTALNRTIVQKMDIFELTETNGMANDLNYPTLAPFHSLITYYSLAGAAKGAPILKLENIGSTIHTDGVDYANFWGDISEKFRLLPVPTTLTPGENIMLLVKFACDVVKEDLTDFFEKASYLKVQDLGITSYPNRMKITQAMVDEVKSYVKNKGYSKPVSPVINYVNAQNKSFYLNRSKLNGVTGTGFTLKTSGTANYLISDTNAWKNVVAYEATDSDGKILYISVAGTGDASNKTTEVYMPTGTQKVFAVGYDGERKLMYPSFVTNVEVIMIKE